MKQLAFGLAGLLLAALVAWLAWSRDPAAPLADLPVAAPEAAGRSATAAATTARPTPANQPAAAPARTAIAADAARDWIVRGRVLRAPQEPYPGAQMEARLIAGYDAEGDPAETTALACDADGRFAWSLRRPTCGVVLRFAGAMPRHGGAGETVRVAPGDPAPQDVEFYVYPLDVAVTGLVTDLDGAPLPGAWVRTTGARVPCAADGGYRVEVSNAFGQAFLTAGAPLHASERRVLRTGDATEQVDFRLRDAFRITGRVVDERGAPVGGAAVMTFFSLRDPTHSGADGRFVVDGLDPDREDHSLVARASGYVEATEQVNAREPAREHELVLRRGARVTGRVFGPDGGPVAGAELYIGFSPSAWNRLDAVSRDDGAFEFPAVDSGAQTLVTQRRGLAPDQRVLQIDPTTRAVEVVVRLGSGHSVAGVVEDEAGAPVTGIPIAVRVASPSSPRGEYIDVHGRSGDDGRFRLEGLPDGEVTLELYGTDWVRAELGGVAVDRDDVRVVLKRAARIAGRVVDAATGAPLTAFRIRIVRYGAGIAATWVREGHSFQSSEGLWDTRGEQLEAGTRWGVEATADGYAPARALDVVAAVEPDADACVLSMLRGGTVEGLVVSGSTGAPIEGATVTWFADERDLQQARHEPYGLLRARTDSTGRFELTDVPPGTTTLAVEATGVPRQVEGPFELRSGERADRRIVVGAGARIRGVVVDVGGHGGEAVLHLSPRRAPGAESRQTEAKVDGSFEFDGLAAGEYELFGYLRHDGATTPVARVVNLAPDENLELRLGPEGSATVRGSVTGEDPVPDGSTVMLGPSGADAASRRAWRGVAIGGKFELRGVPAGDYRLLVLTSTGGMGGATVTVGDGADVVSNVTVARRQR